MQNVSSMDWRFQLLGALVTALVALLSASVPVLVRLFVRYAENKLRIEISDAQEASLESAAAQAVGFAEEAARNQLKKHGVETDSGEKLALARAFVESVLERRGHPIPSNRLGVPAVDAYIEAALHTHRSSNVPPIAKSPVKPDESVSAEPPQS